MFTSTTRYIVASSRLQGELIESRAALRRMALKLSRTQDEEQTRIAECLHDGLGQTLAAVKMRLVDVERAGSEGARRAIMGEINGLVCEAFESLRTLTFELMAPAMPEIGIVAELEHLVTRMAEKWGIKCLFDSDAEPKPVSSDVATTLLRVARELMLNVEKHSGAETVSVDVARAANRIRVTVRDDGIGFEPNQPSTPERASFGLLIVGERLAGIGGDVHIDSNRGSGTRIVLTAPLLDGGGTG